MQLFLKRLTFLFTMFQAKDNLNSTLFNFLEMQTISSYDWHCIDEGLFPDEPGGDVLPSDHVLQGPFYLLFSYGCLVDLGCSVHMAGMVVKLSNTKKLSKANAINFLTSRRYSFCGYFMWFDKLSYRYKKWKNNFNLACVEFVVKHVCHNPTNSTKQNKTTWLVWYYRVSVSTSLYWMGGCCVMLSRRLTNYIVSQITGQRPVWLSKISLNCD